MTALVLKEAHLALEVLRPLIIIIVGAVMLAPLAGLLPLDRFLHYSISPLETLLVVGWAFVMLMPIVGVWFAGAMSSGDARHGGEMLARVIPISLGAQAIVKFVVAAGATLVFAAAAPALAWMVATLVGSLAGISYGPGSELREGVGESVVYGVIGLAAGWGAAGFGRPMIVSMLLGLVGAAIVLIGSIALAEFFVIDFRYSVPWNGSSESMRAAALVTVMALFVAGSLPRLGVLTRTTVLASIVMAAVALSAGAAHAEWAYMRDARRAGRLNYAPDELRARDVAFFIRHLDDPEPGFAPLAARIAIPMKIQLLPTSERIELRQRWIETLLLAEEVNPEVVVAYRGLPWMWSPRPDVELEDRLIAQLDSDASPWKKGMIRNLVHQGFAHRESTAQALERYAASLDDPDLRLSFDEVVSTLRHRLSLLGTTPYSASP